MSRVRRAWMWLRPRAPNIAKFAKRCILFFANRWTLLFLIYRERVSAWRDDIQVRIVKFLGVNAIMEAGSKGGLRCRLNSGIASLCIRYCDYRYRHIFRKVLCQDWNHWFKPRSVSPGSITLVIGSLGPGGSERQVVTTLLGLVARDYHDLSLLCTHFTDATERFYEPLLYGSPVSISQVRENFSAADEMRESSSDVETLGLRTLYENLPGEICDITWYAREFLARNPKIVHTWLDYTNAKAAIAAAVVGVPRIVLSTRSLAPNNFGFFQPYMREAYRALAVYPSVRFLNNSEAGARDYENWIGLPRGSFKVVRNGFDFSEFDRERNIAPARELKVQLGVPDRVLLVGTVLRFTEEKRPFLWIEIAARVAAMRSDVMFLMVGDGPLRMEARQRADACGFGGRILMPGYEKEVAVAIAALDVFLLTSRVEGLPNVLVEAQALGVPVVTTDCGGVSETLIPRVTGFTVASESVELLANTILDVLADDAWRDEARNVAQKFVRERFSLSQMISGTLDAYNSFDVSDNLMTALPLEESPEIGSSIILGLKHEE